MPVVSPPQTLTHTLHGARFISYAAPRTGSEELCAWRTEFPPRTKGTAHTVSREEILLILTGTLLVTLDGRTETAVAGDAVIVNSGSSVALENPADHTALAWVTTSTGLTAHLPDGTEIAPPWAN